jgi:hypothetical protein
MCLKRACVTLRRHYVAGQSTGFKWQCVEYARRYLLLRAGLVFGECVRASELFDQHNVLHDIQLGVEVEWGRHCNGGPTPPNQGDIILYPYVEQKMPWGHVGVISHVSWLPSPVGTGRDGTGECVAIIGIAEQNIHSRHWNGRSYGRCIPLIKRACDGQAPSFTLEEHENTMFDDCLGWKPVKPETPSRHKKCNNCFAGAGCLPRPQHR